MRQRQHGKGLGKRHTWAHTHTQEVEKLLMIALSAVLISDTVIPASSTDSRLFPLFSTNTGAQA